jgi:hypothetical protein
MRRPVARQGRALPGAQTGRADHSAASLLHQLEKAPAELGLLAWEDHREDNNAAFGI